VMFWVPRDIDGGMPAFTTNVEFGWLSRMSYEERNPMRMFYGRPDNAEKCKYLDWMYAHYQDKTPYNDLKTMIKDIVAFV